MVGSALIRDVPLAAATVASWFGLPEGKLKLDAMVNWISRYSAVLYPVIAVVTLALLALAILLAWRSDEVSGIAKVEYKRDILALVRRSPAGLTAEQLSRELQLNRHKAARLVEEMQRDGLVESQVRDGVTKWRLRGLT